MAENKIVAEKWNLNDMTVEYKMESNAFDYEEIRNSETFGIKKYADSVYRGELKDNKREGVGVMVYRKNRVYEGTW